LTEPLLNSEDQGSVQTKNIKQEHHI